MDTQTLPIIPEEVLRRFQLIERAMRLKRYGISRHRDCEGREFFALSLLVPAPAEETCGLGVTNVPLATIMPQSEAKGTVLTGVGCVASGWLLRV